MQPAAQKRGDSKSAGEKWASGAAPFEPKYTNIEPKRGRPVGRARSRQETMTARRLQSGWPRPRIRVRFPRYDGASSERVQVRRLSRRRSPATDTRSDSPRRPKCGVSRGEKIPLIRVKVADEAQNSGRIDIEFSGGRRVSVWGQADHETLCAILREFSRT